MAQEYVVAADNFGDVIKKGDKLLLRGKKNSFVTVFHESKKLELVLPIAGVTFTAAGGMSVEEAATLHEMLSGVKPSAPKVKVKKEKPKPKPKLKDNQIWFSDITGGVLPGSGLDHVVNLFDTEHFPADTRCDIPVADPNYQWDAEVLEMLVLSHKLNKKCLLTGLPGTGKSTAVKQFASIVRQPYMRFNGKDGIEPSSFLGNLWVTKGNMEWKDGLLPIGIKEGYLVTIDEVFKLSAGIQMAMQCLYEDGGSLMLDDKPGTHADKLCQPHPSFRMFLTDNVKGTGDDFSKFSATQMQDTSTLDRFQMVITVDYLKLKDEVKLLTTKFPDVEAPVAKKLVQFAGLVRSGYKADDIAVTLSPRGLFTVCELITEGVPTGTAIQLAFANKLAEDSERMAVRDFMQTVGLS